jgi:voltage-gated potassium channel
MSESPPTTITSRQRIAALEPVVDRLATIGALAVIPVLLVEFGSTDPRWLQVAYLVNWVIWWIFAVDIVVKPVAFGRSWLRTPGAWLSLAVVLLSFPGLTQMLAGMRFVMVARLARAGRIIRILRIARLAILASRALSGLHRVLDPQAMPFVTLAVLGVALAGGAAMYVVETEQVTTLGLPDAIWWAITTMTTVGYGDIVPQSGLGRTVAVVVMVVGITFTSLLTAQVAAYLNRGQNQKITTDLADLEAAFRQETAALHEKLDLLVQASRNPDPPDDAGSSP